MSITCFVEIQQTLLKSWRLPDKTFFFTSSILARFVSMATFKNRWDLPQWVETISIASFLSVCFFLFHFLKDLWRKKKDLRKMEWTEWGQFNICFYLIDNRGWISHKWWRNPGQTKKETLSEIIFEHYFCTVWICSMHDYSFFHHSR